MKKLIVLSDWAHDSLTCQEVRSAIEGFSKDATHARISFVGTTPSTIHTGYVLLQIVETEERYGKPMETVIFVNTDPRIQTSTSVEKAKGAEFVVIRLASGMYLCGPNAGHCFSLIKEKITNVFKYPNFDKGSQFRSRDLYSRVSAHLMDTMEDEMELEEIQLSEVPALTGKYIGHIDNYGNIKTTIPLSSMKGVHEMGEIVKISINHVTKSVTFVSNLFGGTPGELVLYPGSSGKKDDPFLEISVWRHFTEEDKTTGMHAFNNPYPGEDIVIQ